jgi:histidine ammonia-lyase
MSMAAALKAERALAAAREVVAIDILGACQAIDLRAPLAMPAPLARVVARVRERADARWSAPDIRAIIALIERGGLETACGVGVK